jgi:hypothetical protein
MTINSLSAIQSTPFCGLGTQTYNVPTTGTYTVGFNVTIPWMTSDQPQAIAAPESIEVQDVTLAADSSGSRNSTWWYFTTAGDAYMYYVWYNINSAGVDPAPAGYTAGIEVAGATNATATTLATATRAAILASGAASYVSVSGATTHVILTNKQYGKTTAAANGTATAGASFSITTTGTYGYASGLVIKIYKGSTLLLTQSNPSPTQAFMAGSYIGAFTAGDAITVVTSSLSDADAALNAVKGIINIYAGQ